MRITQIDAFTDSPFKGNPAAVCLLPEYPPDLWMQQVAQEMNLSETAFLVPFEEGFHLRWFTPLVEVELCGHATLASAHFLWEAGELATSDTARFDTASGLLEADYRNGWIEMDFPSESPERRSRSENLVGALGIEPVYFGENRFDYLVEVETENEVTRLIPDLSELASLTCRGVIVTSRSDRAEFDFVSRYFAPAVGVNEDPVTGSAHCCLGPYWAERRGKTRLIDYQASARGGVVRVEVRGDRVVLSGQAITVMQAELSAGPIALASY